MLRNQLSELEKQIKDKERKFSSLPTIEEKDDNDYIKDNKQLAMLV